MIRVYYIDSDEGGGDDPRSIPKGYKPLSASQRREWNDFLDWMQSKGVAGNKELDATDKNTGLTYLEKYRQENPSTSVTPDMIPFVQYEQKQLRAGSSFPGVGADQLKMLRSQMNPDYLQRPVANVGDPFNSTLSREYYPSFKMGEKDYGTDMDAYLHDAYASRNKTIPLPDYSDTTSRMKYLEQWQRKYGDLQHRGDTVLKVNETPRGGSSSAKDISTKAAKEYGLDPALLYASAMEEGMSGLFKDKSGLDTQHRKPGQFGYQDYYGDKDFPINGGQSFGFQTFAERFPDLVKGGYLPKDFEKEFRGVKAALADEDESHDANNFRTVEGAMKAKAAMVKFNYDETEKYAKDKGIELSKKAKDFFALAAFNGGEGGMHRLMKEYNEKGLLKDDKFLKENPDKGVAPNLDIWQHIVPRLRMASALKQEKLFENEN